MSSSQSIIQNYQAMGEGKVEVPTFDITVNDQSFSVKGKSLTVTAQTQQRRSNFQDPFQDFFQLETKSAEREEEGLYNTFKENFLLASFLPKN